MTIPVEQSKCSQTHVPIFSIDGGICKLGGREYSVHIPISWVTPSEDVVADWLPATDCDATVPAQRVRMLNYPGDGGAYLYTIISTKKCSVSLVGFGEPFAHLEPFRWLMYTFSGGKFWGEISMEGTMLENLRCLNGKYLRFCCAQL